MDDLSENFRGHEPQGAVLVATPAGAAVLARPVREGPSTLRTV